MSAALMNKMDELRAELKDALERLRIEDQAKKALEKAYLRASSERDAAIEREQALAAHVERLREDVYDQANTILGEFGVRETIEDYLPGSYNDTPATSLARRDLIKQAEALEAEAAGWPEDKYTECSHVRESILISANELRKRAQALK